ncbi:MAG: ribonuclease R [Verrucomicrobiales bacterium]|nr:ribonuclease R [Verrucomicrobiales bacterium]
MDDKLLKWLGRKDYTPSSAAELLKPLGLNRKQLEALEETLHRLEQSGVIVRTRAQRYIMSREADLIPGTIQINRQGKGFLQPDEAGAEEIVIPESQTSTAMHGDRVLVRREVVAQARAGGAKEPQTGSVIRILERRKKQIVGTLQRTKEFLYVIPDDPRLPHDVYVPPPRDVGRPAYPGDKVVVELLRWESRHSNPEGEIIEVLGAPDEEGVDMLSILRNYELPLHFPRPVLQDADAILSQRSLADASPQDLEGRVDCRSHSVITIDPDDAKDFDDAIALQEGPDGQWRLWVHIADVSHYVTPGSLLDREARLRGNSTYLVDRVIPMLPEVLSNELCSLKPHVDRLTKCAEFLLEPDGRVIRTKFYPAVIRSVRRYTYQEVFARLQVPPVDPLDRLLHQANQLAQSIRRSRFKAGSLDLDFPEMKIRLDERGKVSRIERVENDVSHQLIEEFMLLANEAVAARLRTLHRPAVYRVHEAPKERRLEDYRQDVISHRVPCGPLAKRTEVQKLLAKLKTIPVGPALKIGFLRSLMRARYDVQPLGHYGLHKTDYTHFTSPIRRYADLLVHRALFDTKLLSMAEMKSAAEHISLKERNSADAERDSKEVKLYAYLREQLKTGKRVAYAGLVTDVRNFGFFVDVPELGLSGLVHLSTLGTDFFVFDASRGHLVGRRTRQIIQLGDRIPVQIHKVDVFKKQVDFECVPPAKAGGLTPSKARPPQVQRHQGSQRRPQRPGNWPQEPGNRPQRSTNRSSETHPRPSSPPNRLQVSSHRAPGTGGRLQTSGTRPPDVGNRPSGSGNRNQSAPPRLQASGSRPPGGGARLQVSSSRPPSSGGRPQSSGNRPPGSKRRPGGPNDRPSGSGGQSRSRRRRR